MTLHYLLMPMTLIHHRVHAFAGLVKDRAKATLVPG